MRLERMVIGLMINSLNLWLGLLSETFLFIAKNIPENFAPAPPIGKEAIENVPLAIVLESHSI